MLLAVDSSSAQMGLALGDGSQLIAESIWYSHQHHTTQLAPGLLELMKHCGASINDVEALAVAIGPGSFTGLRVGLALVKGLAISRKLPLVGVPTLDVLAAGQAASTLPLAGVLQAGRGRIAVGWYRWKMAKPQPSSSGSGPAEGGWQAQGAAELATVDSLAKSIDSPTLVAGELTSEERQRLARKKINVVLAPPNLCVRRPSLLLEIAWARFQNGQVDDPAGLAPIYLHLSDAIPA